MSFPLRWEQLYQAVPEENKTNPNLLCQNRNMTKNIWPSIHFNHRPMTLMSCVFLFFYIYHKINPMTGILYGNLFFFFFESHSNSPLAQPAGHIVYCNTSTFEDELSSPVLGMRRQNRIKIHRCKCDCVSRRIYIRTLGTDELLSDWGRWPITLEICLLTFGKVSTSKFKAAIGQIWDVGMMICPLAHYFIIIFFSSTSPCMYTK